jgi:hypothetical protein
MRVILGVSQSDCLPQRFFHCCCRDEFAALSDAPRERSEMIPPVS